MAGDSPRNLRNRGPEARPTEVCFDLKHCLLVRLTYKKAELGEELRPKSGCSGDPQVILRWRDVTRAGYIMVTQHIPTFFSAEEFGAHDNDAGSFSVSMCHALSEAGSTVYNIV